MVKVSFFGNCQLENVGNLIRQVAQQHPALGLEVVWTKAVYQTKPEEYIQAILALEHSDIIYTQYHDTQWGIYSTRNLQKLFKLRIVPTLESFVSVPQTGEWHVMPDLAALNVHYLDFRMLDLYLKDTPVEEVATQYFAIAPRAGAMEKEIQRMAGRYRDYFTSGKVIFDYSSVYEAAMRENLQAYHSYNHPNNQQLAWMLNSIMADMGCPTQINLDGPELLYQFHMPSLVSAPRGDYVISGHTLSLPHVAKITYAYLNAIARDVLVKELENSVYFKLMDAGELR